MVRNSTPTSLGLFKGTTRKKTAPFWGVAIAIYFPGGIVVTCLMSFLGELSNPKARVVGDLQVGDEVWCALNHLDSNSWITFSITINWGVASDQHLHSGIH